MKAGHPKYVLMFSLILLSIVACTKKEPEPTSQELVEGKWTIVSSEVLANVVPGNGSYLHFDACSSSCSGVDFNGNDTTSGTFTYSINEEATLITITDTNSDGGTWDGTWDILELSESDFRITTTTAFGSMKLEMSK